MQEVYELINEISPQMPKTIDDIDDDKFFSLLFANENDYEMCKGILKKMYDDSKKMWDLDELFAEIAEYNDEILYELTYQEIYVTCPTCDRKNDCWKGMDPHGGNRPTDDMDIEDCFGSELQANWEMADYYYGVNSVENLVLRILIDFGYSVMVDHFYWDGVFGIPMPKHLPDDYFTYFNDAQGILIPEFMQPYEFASGGQLQLTGG